VVGREHAQQQFAVRMDWGLRGAREISQDADFAVICDVLSFTTTVSVAVDQGAEVYPYPWRDESAEAFARQHGAVLAVGRAEAAAADGATRQAWGRRPLVSLSPTSVRATTGLDRIVLPSPNGSALSAALASAGCTIVAACLRNRAAVAAWLANQTATTRPAPVIAMIAAGERWPDGTLRPAVEDLWGAGAVIAALASLGVTGLSPEAHAAAAAWRLIELAPAAPLAACASGVELTDAGFGEDVTIGAELDASSCVPLLSGGRFADAGKAPDRLAAGQQAPPQPGS
jgi:2-phosphosulfolactate phosphatase